MRLAAAFCLFLRVESEEQDDQNEDDRSYTHGCFQSPASNCCCEEAEDNADERT